MMILCCGEALIDMIPKPTTDGATGFVPFSGGAVFNTAIGLGRLGVRTGMLTGLSTDRFGHQLAAELRASHVETDHLIRSNRPTTLAFVHLVDGHATYTFFDENSAGRILSAEDMPALPDDIGTLYLGGISLAVEPCADAYAALAKREADKRVIMIDPNIRPSFIAEPDRFRARMAELLKVADIVKLSDEDLGWLVPGAEALEEKVRYVLDLGAKLMILTRGGEGAQGYLSTGEVVTVPAKRVQIVDTVGAGDTFNAGVLAQLSTAGFLSKERLSTLKAEDVTAALAHGARVAAITVSREGANPPWADELTKV